MHPLSHVSVAPHGPLLWSCAPAPRRASLSRWRNGRHVSPPKLLRAWSQYVPMRDGVKLAIDVHLPQGPNAPARIPAIVRQTRYLRAVEYRWPFRHFFKRWFFDTQATTRDRFLQSGYAWIDVDVRGSGASSGVWTSPWSRELVRDGHDLAAWIVAQPWSDGSIGSLGISYDGACADFLLVEHHPGVKAIAPRFSPFDVCADVAYPGGIALEWFLAHWQRMNKDFDENRPYRFPRWWVPTLLRGSLTHHLPIRWLANTIGLGLGWLASLLLFAVFRGAKPTDEDPDRSLLAKAVADHGDNFDVYANSHQVTFRDDSPPGPGLLMDSFSPHTFLEETRRSPVAVLSTSGWFDGAYPRAAIARHLSLDRPGNELLIGPWNHGGTFQIDPRRGYVKCPYDHDGDLLRFFDRHLKGRTDLPTERVRYYTLGEGWKTAATWPPPSASLQRRYLAEGTLRPDPGGDTPWSRALTPTSGTGDFTRWKALLGMPVRYAHRRRQDRRHLVFDAAPLTAALEVTGHPTLTLRLAIDREDAQLFVYLENVSPSGKVTYVTEGQLRLLHRKLGQRPYTLPAPYHSQLRADGAPLVPGQPTEVVIELLPTSYRFEAGDLPRIAIAAADVDNFAVGPAVTLTVLGGARSFLDLPVVPSPR